MTASRVAVAAFLALAAVGLAAQAGAARKPTTKEKREITRVVLLELERDSPTIPIRVLGIEVSTQSPGATSPYSKFARASFTGRDETGRPLDVIYGILGYSKRFKAWTMISYGSSSVGCSRSEARLFGGRRAAIFRDLDMRCP